jgi:hypothetical protein
MHKQPPKAMTQLSANRIGAATVHPLEAERAAFQKHYSRAAVQSVQQVDRAISRKLNAADQLGNIPSSNSMLD